MAKKYRPRGISVPLATSKGKPSTLRKGRVAGVPFLSTFFAKRAVSKREKAIKAVKDKVDTLVTSESQKVENVIRQAEETNNHKLIVRARSLREQLENASCREPKFEEGPDEGSEPHAPKMTKAERDALLKDCAASANAATGMNWESTRGHFSTKDPAKLDIAKKWQETYESCQAQKGL